MNETFYDAIPASALAAATTVSTRGVHTPCAAALSEGAHFQFVGTTDGHIFSYKSQLLADNCYFSGVCAPVRDIFPTGFGTVLVYQDSRLLYASLPRSVRFVNGAAEPQPLEVLYEIPLTEAFLIRPRRFERTTFEAVGFGLETHSFYLFCNDSALYIKISALAPRISDFVVVDRVIIAQDSNILFAYSEVARDTPYFALSGVLDCRKSVCEANFFPVYQREPIKAHRSLYCAVGPRYAGHRSFGDFLVSGGASQTTDGALNAADNGNVAAKAENDFCVLVQYAAAAFAEISVSTSADTAQAAQDIAAYRNVLRDCGATDDATDLANAATQLASVTLMYKIPGFEAYLRNKAHLHSIALYKSPFSQTFGLISESALLNALLYCTNCYYQIEAFTRTPAAADIKTSSTAIFTPAESRIELKTAQALIVIADDSKDDCNVFLFAEATQEHINDSVPYLAELAKNRQFIEREDEFDKEPDNNLTGLRYCDIVRLKLLEIQGRLRECPDAYFPPRSDAMRVVPL